MTGSQDDKSVEVPPQIDFMANFIVENKPVTFGMKALDLTSAVATATILAATMAFRGANVGGFTILRDGKIEAFVPVQSLLLEAAPIFNQAAGNMVIPGAIIKGVNAEVDFNKIMNEAKKMKG